MRRLILPGTFLILLAAVYFLWQHRFERSPEYPTLRLADLRATNRLPAGAEWLGTETQPKLRLRMDPALPRVVVRFDLPEMGAVDLLHVRFQASATNLSPGKEVWDDGRCMIEWQSGPGGGDPEIDPFYSARFTSPAEVAEWVMRPDQPPAIPALRIEHLGASGDFELSQFEATVVRERWMWKIGRWILMGAWLAWAIAWIGPRGKVGHIRPVLAASVWLVMGLYFVVPGPWKSYKSFGTTFQIDGEAAPSKGAAARVSSAKITALPVVLESVGKIPTKGDFALRLKYYASKARPLLHAVLLFGPTLLIACLVGRKPGCSLAVIFALAIEAAQFSFGYGFDWVDIGDLLCDATGIVLALAVHRRFMERASASAAGSRIRAAASGWSESGSRKIRGIRRQSNQ